MKIFKSIFFYFGILVLLVKLFESFYFIDALNPDFINDSVWYELPTEGWGDEGYVSGPENWLQKGVWIHYASGMQAARLPGVSVIYLFFRLFVEQQWSLNLMILFSIILYAISISYFVSLLHLKKKFLILIVLLLVVADSYISVWFNVPILSEGYCVSFFILNISFLLKWQRSKEKKFLFISGLFIAAACLTKVTFFPVLLTEMVLLAIYTKLQLRNVFLFLIPFVVFESGWITRNYLEIGKFIPLQEVGTINWKGILKDHVVSVEKEDEKRLDLLIKSAKGLEKRLIKSFGGNNVKWNDNSAQYWFNNIKSDFRPEFKKELFNTAFPKFIFNHDKKFTEEAFFIAVKSKAVLLNKNVNLAEREVKGEEYVTFLKGFTEINKSNFWSYHVLSRVFLIKQWFLTSATYQIPYEFNRAGALGKFIKIKAMLSYYVTIILGAIIVLFLVFRLPAVFKTKSVIYLLVLVCISINFLIYIGVSRTCELRYNTFIYLSFMIAIITVISTLKIEKNSSDKRSLKISII